MVTAAAAAVVVALGIVVVVVDVVVVATVMDSPEIVDVAAWTFAAAVVDSALGVHLVPTAASSVGAVRTHRGYVSAVWLRF